MSKRIGPTISELVESLDYSHISGILPQHDPSGEASIKESSWDGTLVKLTYLERRDGSRAHYLYFENPRNPVASVDDPQETWKFDIPNNDVVGGIVYAHFDAFMDEQPGEIGKGDVYRWRVNELPHQFITQMDSITERQNKIYHHSTSYDVALRIRALDNSYFLYIGKPENMPDRYAPGTDIGSALSLEDTTVTKTIHAATEALAGLTVGFAASPFNKPNDHNSLNTYKIQSVDERRHHEAASDVAAFLPSIL